MNKLKLLVVEDDPIIATDLGRSVTHMGYEVIDTVESGPNLRSHTIGDAYVMIKDQMIPIGRSYREDLFGLIKWYL